MKRESRPQGPGRHRIPGRGYPLAGRREGAAPGQDPGQGVHREMEEGNLPGLPVTIGRPRTKTGGLGGGQEQVLRADPDPRGRRRGLPRARAARLSRRELATPGLAPRKMTAVARGGGLGAAGGADAAARRKAQRRLHLLRGSQEIQRAARHGLHQVDVMEFGDWIKPISKLLLQGAQFHPRPPAALQLRYRHHPAHRHRAGGVLAGDPQEHREHEAHGRGGPAGERDARQVQGQPAASSSRRSWRSTRRTRSTRWAAACPC
jgi:hypothetical protein